MKDEPPKKRGRKKTWDREDGRRGAPQVTLRLSPETIHHIKTHPEGARPYVERLVAEDIGRTQPIESPSPEDVPGQLLLGGHQDVPG